MASNTTARILGGADHDPRGKRRPTTTNWRDQRLLFSARNDRGTFQPSPEAPPRGKSHGSGAKRTLLTILTGLLALACGCPGVARFPNRAPLWEDDDARPFVTPCVPDPEEPGHELCAPETYVSPFAWDAADNTIFRPLARFFAVDPGGEAINANSLDEVPNSSWFTNRLGQKSFTPDEIVHGPCGDKVLDPAGPAGSWLVDQGKPNGASAGFRVKVEGVGKFMIKADMAGQGERATAAGTIGARLYWAFGFDVPCETVVRFHPSILKLKPGLVATDNAGTSRPFDQKALEGVLKLAIPVGDRVRMSASRWLPGRTMGPFRYEGTREDDPNDVIPHEDRRELRGARLLAAWINHFDAREQNSMNTWVALDQNDPDSTPGYVKHWYMDFSDSFGSQWDWDGVSRRLGHAYYLDFGYLSEDFVTLGLFERPWDRAELGQKAPLFGYFSERDFDPEAWRGGYPNPAFGRMTERDGAWAARIIARFTREHLVAAIGTAELSNPAHAEYLLDVLRIRQARILRRYLGRLSPLSDASMRGSELCAVDLARSSFAFAGQRFAYSARLSGGAGYATLATPKPRVEAGGRVCVPLPAPPKTDDPESFFLLDVYNGNAPGPLRLHLYAVPGQGYVLAGLERPEP